MRVPRRRLRIGRPDTIRSSTRACARGVRELCRRFSDAYWRDLDGRRAYPEDFVRALTEAGYLAALIPEEYGGAGLGVTEAAIILEEINRSGCNAGACHAQIYIMGTVLRHGSSEQKRTYLPQIASGALRLQAFGVTEPTTGSDTTQIQTMAVRKGDAYVVNGQKVWISRAEHSDLLLLLVRTTAADQVEKRSDGLSILLVDLRSAAEDREGQHLADAGHGPQPVKRVGVVLFRRAHEG